MTIDPNNRPGGAQSHLTAKSANKLQFFDAASLAPTGEIAMPGSTQLVRSADGAKVYGSIYGGRIFGKNTNGLRIRHVVLSGNGLLRNGEPFNP